MVWDRNFQAQDLPLTAVLRWWWGRRGCVEGGTENRGSRGFFWYFVAFFLGFQYLRKTNRGLIISTNTYYL